MAKRILVVAPHPDDEILGCGGSLLRYIDEGAEVAWLICTRPPDDMDWSDEFLLQREKDILKVQELMGFCKVYELGLLATKLDQIPVGKIISKMSEVFKEFAPHDVYTPHWGDVHTDHKVVFDCVNACSKWFRYPSIKKLVAYETPSETDFNYKDGQQFHPNSFVDISLYLDRKLHIMSVYETELGVFPFPRSLVTLESLARLRGSAAGYEAAEAFQLLFERI